MKSKLFFLFVFFFPFILFAQENRQSWYGSAGVGYGSYKVHIYNYAHGADNYADLRLTSPILWLGMEKKSAWHANDFVFDVGGELNAGLGVKNNASGFGVKNNAGNGLFDTTINGGWSLGIHGLFKAGYQAGGEKGKIVPLLGVGPYYIFIKNGSGDLASGNQVYGVQGYAGIDFQLSDRFVVTPQVHFGVASWGYSDLGIGPAGNNVQNGQPSMLEAGLKIAIKL
jgi:hypothetical protein